MLPSLSDILRDWIEARHGQWHWFKGNNLRFTRDNIRQYGSYHAIIIYDDTIECDVDGKSIIHAADPQFFAKLELLMDSLQEIVDIENIHANSGMPH